MKTRAASFPEAAAAAPVKSVSFKDVATLVPSFLALADIASTGWMKCEPHYHLEWYDRDTYCDQIWEIRSALNIGKNEHPVDGESSDVYSPTTPTHRKDTIVSRSVTVPAS